MTSRTKILVSTGLILIIGVGIWAGLNYWPTDPGLNEQFPDFITSNDDYFITRIGDVPSVDADTYRLNVSGFIDNPGSFTLEDLQNLAMVDLPLTVECIGNTIDGKLVSTAVWRGFVLYDFLLSLGLNENATGVEYRAADGYYASHTMDQIRDNGIVAALYMNDEIIPPIQGFPLRILNPGYYGAKQPAWVTDIEVVNQSLDDYWDDRGWDSSPPMEIDSIIFFPLGTQTLSVNDTLDLGGAAFGGTRVAKVEYTLDNGASWTPAEIVQRLDADNVWVFWDASIFFSETGNFVVEIRATDIHNNTQTEQDPAYYDGTNIWPKLIVNVV